MLQIHLKKKKLLSGIAVRFAQSRAQNDPEFLADITKAFLKKYFNQIAKDDLLYYFENNKDLTELIAPNLDKIGEFAEKINLDTKQIKELIDQHMPGFEIAWIKTWWKENHKHLYAALVNQPKDKQEKMEIWIVEQVTAITEKLTSKL